MYWLECFRSRRFHILTVEWLKDFSFPDLSDCRSICLISTVTFDDLFSLILVGYKSRCLLTQIPPKPLPSYFLSPFVFHSSARYKTFLQEQGSDLPGHQNCSFLTKWSNASKKNSPTTHLCRNRRGGDV
jgi:hypothetical protein